MSSNWQGISSLKGDTVVSLRVEHWTGNQEVAGLTSTWALLGNLFTPLCVCRQTV